MNTKKVLLAGTFLSASAFEFWPAGSVARLANQLPLGFGDHSAATFPKAEQARFKCNLADPLDPSDDGLYSSHDLFSSQGTIETLVERHQPLVQVDSICYDDLGDFDTDDRWKPFDEIPKVLEKHYPLM